MLGYIGSHFPCLKFEEFYHLKLRVLFLFLNACNQDKGTFLVVFLGIIFSGDLRKDILRTETLFLIGK